jgi:hypothetical protein
MVCKEDRLSEVFYLLTGLLKKTFLLSKGLEVAGE